VCTDLCRDLDLHFLRVPRASRLALRGSYSVATLSSKRPPLVASSPQGITFDKRSDIPTASFSYAPIK
jgi:hypothetical protein